MMKQKNNDEKITDEQIIEQYKKMPVLSSLSVYFNLPDVTIWRRCKKLNLLFKIGTHGRSGNGYDLFDILDGKYPQYQTLKLKNRLIKENILENKCSCCSVTIYFRK